MVNRSLVESLDAIDRHLINRLQQSFPLCQEPFAAIGDEIQLHSDEVIARIQRLLECGVLTRFGPLFQIEKRGGAFVLAALHAPAEQFDQIAAIVNGFAEVAHNYEREHWLNMWFVIAVEHRDDVARVTETIEQMTHCKVYAFPKQHEYFIGLHLPV